MRNITFVLFNLFSIGVLRLLAQGIPAATINSDDKIGVNFHLAQSFHSWKDLLQYAEKKGGKDNILIRNGLKLVGYKVSQFDVSFEKRRSFNPSSPGVIVVNAESIENNFVIGKLEKFPNLIPIYNEWKQAILRNFSKENPIAVLQVINLKWKYKNKILYTKCIVSDAPNTIVYDDFLSNITLLKISE